MNFNILKSKIENFSKEDQIEILRIIHNSGLYITENNNGCFLSMEDLDQDTVNKIIEYVNYNEKKENELNNIEEKKDKISNILLNND